MPRIVVVMALALLTACGSANTQASPPTTADPQAATLTRLQAVADSMALCARPMCVNPNAAADVLADLRATDTGYEQVYKDLYGSGIATSIMCAKGSSDLACGVAWSDLEDDVRTAIAALTR
jgi:hypothetical protein